MAQNNMIMVYFSIKMIISLLPKLHWFNAKVYQH